MIIRIQAGRGVNEPGKSEIPESAFDELIVNAIVHRDYLVSPPIRIFIFDNRIEIISPGHLPNNLTVEKIRVGNSNIRNPILVSYVAKGLLPYHGLGSGIKRALSEWERIDFKDDHDGCLFTTTVHRKQFDPSMISEERSEKSSEKGSEKTESLIVELVSHDPKITISKLADTLNVSTRAVEKHLSKLKQSGKLERIGGRKDGYWKIRG